MKEDFKELGLSKEILDAINKLGYKLSDFN